MAQLVMSGMTRPDENGAPGEADFENIEHAELGTGYSLAAAHNREALFLDIRGVTAEAVEIVLTPPERGTWSFFIPADGQPDISLPVNARVAPRCEALRAASGLLFSVRHIDLAPQNTLAATPVAGESWGVAIRIFPSGAGAMPVAWLDDDTALKFEGGREAAVVALKKDKPAATGVGLLLIRLDFGEAIPAETDIAMEPKELFIPVKSKDLSYVKGRIAMPGVFRLKVDVPAEKTPVEDQEATEEDAEEPAGEQDVPTDTAVAAGMSFMVPDVWGRAERMDDHIRKLTGLVDTKSEEMGKALAEFDEMLIAVERYRTPQAKGVLKEEELATLEECFWRAVAALRSAAADRNELHLVCPYTEGGAFIRGMACAAADASQARKFSEKAARMGLDFLLLACSPEDLPQSSTCLIIPGSTMYHYTRVLRYGSGGQTFDALLPPAPAARVLPEHLTTVRAVAGDLPYWHESLAAGYRLSYLALDDGHEEDNGSVLIHVQAERTEEDIIHAMRNGSYYTRIVPAPEIENIKTTGLTVNLNRQAYDGMATTVYLGRAGAPLGMAPGAESTYTYNGQEQFTRVQILAGASQVNGKAVNLLTVLNPVYCSDWVTPWLDEVYAEERVVQDDGEDY
ncbi:MAG: hypothetical protein JW909_00790 [Planctomycetes bacterium]|nr:hypothetical protein [Planctomycetota bacterium]